MPVRLGPEAGVSLVIIAFHDVGKKFLNCIERTFNAHGRPDRAQENVEHERKVFRAIAVMLAQKQLDLLQ